MAVRTFGTLAFVKDPEREYWAIDAEPHVRIRIKDIFHSIRKTARGELTITHSPAAAKDIDWFLRRYPLQMKDDDRMRLDRGVSDYDGRQEDLERILMPKYEPIPVDLKKPLRNYQGQAVDLYRTTKRLLLGDDTGLGKTVVKIGALVSEPKMRPALVVCQTHLPFQWAEMIVQFAPELLFHIVKTRRAYSPPPADVFIMSYSKLTGWEDLFRTGYFKSVCFDECQEIRVWGSGKYEAARIASENAEYCMGMSATPVYNYGNEIWNVMNVIRPRSLGGRDEFRREWCGEYSSTGKVQDPEALGSHLRENYLMIRRTRVDVGRELPPVNKIVHNVEHSDKSVADIRKRVEQIAARVMSGSFIERGQAARELDIHARMLTGVGKAASVAAYVRILLENGEKVLLAGWHREVYKVWNAALSDFNPVMYTGTESPQKKERAKRDFMRGGSKLMMISLRSGVGLDGLQEASNIVVFGELDWSPGVHNQIIGRLRRDGQDTQVMAVYLISQCGTDPLMVELLGLKSSQSDGIMNPTGQTSFIQETNDDRIKILASRILDGTIKI